MKRVSAFAQGYGGQGGRKYTEADVSAFSREKKFSPSPRAIDPYREQRVREKKFSPFQRTICLCREQRLLQIQRQRIQSFLRPKKRNIITLKQEKSHLRVTFASSGNYARKPSFLSVPVANAVSESSPLAKAATSVHSRISSLPEKSAKLPGAS